RPSSPGRGTSRPPEGWTGRSRSVAGLDSGLAARELLAQGLQRLVGGQRTAGLHRLGLLAARAVRRRLAGLDLGHLRLGLLLDVRLPASVRLGVLLLPDGPLLVEAL